MALDSIFWQGKDSSAPSDVDPLNGEDQHPITCGTSPEAKLAEEESPDYTPLQEEIFASMSDNEDLLAPYSSSGAETLSDLHDQSNIPEVEIISLLEEKIPLYKLRADTTSHYSYDHSDWLRTLPGSTSGYETVDENDDDYDLSPEMMEETLKYFTLCGERVVQMTKTYNDIEAVTKLLEEKEKDLELAAKIGQTLLDQNKKFENRIEELEEQLTVIDDSNTQLRHDLKLKNDLLKIYTNDPEYSDSEEEAQGKKQHPQYMKIETLQRKVKNLEDENFKMRIEVANMRDTTSCLEEKEQQLMRGFIQELGETKGTNEVLTDELTKKMEENFRQQEEITNLLAELVDSQQKIKRLSLENEEFQQHLTAAKEAQAELTEEIQIQREKYEELGAMLREAQERNKEKSRETIPYAGALGNFNVMNPLPVFPADSLAAELVGSMEQEMGGDPYLSKAGKKKYNRNVMQTVKAVNKRSYLSQSDINSDYQTTRPASPTSSNLSLPGTPHSELYEGDNELESMGGSSIKSASRRIPGSNDLETALRRLQLRRQNEDAERKYHDTHASEGSGQHTPTCPTPDSFMSSLSGFSSGGVLGGFKSYMPEKLQIVKPMEGSLTLHHWQRLATPHMASMLDQRPGVMVKGFREIDRGTEVYSLGDIEDDGQIIGNTVPSKCYVNTSSTYTYTNCNIGILDDSIMTSSTQSAARMSSSLHPVSHPKSTATRTFSTSLGLAQVLHERNTNELPNIKTKAEVAGLSKPKQQTIGLNLLSTDTGNEKKPEQPVSAPAGVIQVTGGIFSRNTAPVTSKGTKMKSMDKDTKKRLLEKVKNIRESKCATTNALMVAAPRTLMVPSTRNLGISMSTMVHSSPSKLRPVSSTIPFHSSGSSLATSPGSQATTPSSASGLGLNLFGQTSPIVSNPSHILSSTPPSARGRGLNAFTSPMSLFAGLSGVHKGSYQPTTKS